MIIYAIKPNLSRQLNLQIVLKTLEIIFQNLFILTFKHLSQIYNIFLQITNSFKLSIF